MCAELGAGAVREEGLSWMGGPHQADYCLMGVFFLFFYDGTEGQVMEGGRLSGVSAVNLPVR